MLKVRIASVTNALASMAMLKLKFQNKNKTLIVSLVLSVVQLLLSIVSAFIEDLTTFLGI